MILIGRDVKVGACLYVGDMDSMVRFYRDTLGFHTQWDGGDFAEFETASGRAVLVHVQQESFRAGDRGELCPSQRHQSDV